MIGRGHLLVLAGFLTVFAVGPALSFPAWAGESPTLSDGPAEPDSSPARAKESRSGTHGERGLCREDIFEILKGGSSPTDPGVVAHLWRVAESLACRNWTPPRVTVRLVPSDPVPAAPSRR